VSEEINEETRKEELLQEVLENSKEI